MTSPFPNGQDETIRTLVERIEYMTSGSRVLRIRSDAHRINELAHRALTIMDRLTSNEDAWAEKYAEAKDLGLSDGESEAAADHEVGRTK